MYLLIAAFKVFLKVCLSCFSILITMSPNRFSFEFILKDKLETKWTSWIRKSLPLSEILDNYLLIFFWLQLFLLTFWNSNYIYIWTFCPTATKLWSFLKYPFFSVFQIQYFLCSMFKFSDSSVTCRPPVTLDSIFFHILYFQFSNPICFYTLLLHYEFLTFSFSILSFTPH